MHNQSPLRNILPLVFSLSTPSAAPSSLTLKVWIEELEKVVTEMEFFSLLMLASMPMLEVLLAGLVGALLATNYLNILTSGARREMNKIVFVVFVPALMFASLAKTVTLRDLISWWFMLVNVGLTFLIGGILGWIAVKILKPNRNLEGVIIASCSAGNLGTMPLIIIPAMCKQEGSPFGDAQTCNTEGLSYVSLSMALGNLFIWTHTYSLIRKAADMYERSQRERDLSASEQANVIVTQNEYARDYEEALLLPSYRANEQVAEKQSISSSNFREKLKENLQHTAKELISPPNIAAVAGFAVGAISWLKSLFVGETAPLRVLLDSTALLGEGTVPCTVLILGGNLTEGARKTLIKPVVIMAVIIARFVILPLFGIAVVMAAGHLGFLPQSTLYRYVLLIQFIVPPAMSIGTMAQLFDVCKEECSVIFLWTYLVAALALTAWSMVFMWILS